MGLVVNTLLERPVESIAGLLLMAAGLPAYAYWRRKRVRLSACVEREVLPGSAGGVPPGRERVLRSRTMRIAVIGAGAVGGATAPCWLGPATT